MERDTLLAENKTFVDSATGSTSSEASEIWYCNDPLEKWGGDDVGNDEPEEKATG